MMTKLQREELDYEIEHMDKDPWKPLNIRTEKRPWYESDAVIFFAWVGIFILLAVLAVFAFDKVERFMALRWPNL